MRSFLMPYTEVRYSPLHYVLLVVLITQSRLSVA